LTGNVNADTLRLEFDGRDLLLRLNEEGAAIRFAGFDPRQAGMQAPVSEISLPWPGISLTFGDLLARGVRIIGTPNDDVLTGTALADWIEGRGADDTMSGGAGGDLYLIDADAGSDTIIDSENGDAPNTLVLPEGTTLDDVRLSYDAEGFLILDLDNTGNRVRLSGFDPQNPLGPRAVERFRFGLAGPEIGYEELLARGFDIVGTDESDALKGTALTDRVRGGDGNDMIDATPGDDTLSGESGNDTYEVQLGDGIVTIDDVAAENAGNLLRFGPGIDPNVLRNNLRFEADGNGGHVLLIPYGDAGDVVRLSGFNPDDVLGTRAVDRFEFADGTVVDYATLVSWTFVVEGDNAGNALEGTNVGDRLYGYDGDDVLEAGTGIDELHGGTGNDLLHGAEGDDAYVFNKGDGIDTIIDSGATDFNYIRFGTDIRPEDIRHEWDGTTLVLHYSNDDAVRIDNYYGSEGNPVILALAFEDGTVVSLTEQMNRAPVAIRPLDDTMATEDQDFSLILPADMFSDPDASDDIHVVVRLANGDPLPTWLSFDPISRTLSGRPTNDHVGDMAIVVEGKDHFGAAASTTFNISVQNTNDAPEVGTPLSGLRALEDSAFSFTLPAGGFRDVDVGDALTYSATLANGDPLPTWLTFDAQTGTFSGTPANGDVGSVSVRLTASDVAGASASQTFAIGVTNVNDAPEVGTLLVKQTGRAGTALSWQLPGTAFVDVDAGDVLTYSATLSDGSALPTWLAFDAASGSFSGTPGSAGNYALRVSATDLAGAQASQTFALDVTGGNLPPVTAPDTASVIEDRKLLTWGNVLANDRDPQGERLRVADPGLRRGEHGVLKLLPNGNYAYALDNRSSKVQGLGAGETLTERFGYLASDGTHQQRGELAVTVQGSNDAPQRARSLHDVRLARGQAFTWQVPGGSFTDRDRNDTLTYTATLSSGQALPGWLQFDAATQTFSGTAPASGRGSIAVRVTASDGHSECSTASDVFKIGFGNKTVIPRGNAGDAGDEADDDGQDGAPPRRKLHHHNGSGILPGQQPGRHPESDRDGDRLERFLEGFHSDRLAAFAALPLLDRKWFEQWDERQGEREPTRRASTETGANHEFRRRWSDLTQALSRLDAERQSAPAWSQMNQGAAVAGLAGLMQGSAQGSRGGIDTISLAVGSGTQLRAFTGLREGLSRLSS